MKTKRFNIVTNSQHRACLLFDRKSRGMYQSPASASRYFVSGKNISIDILNKTVLSLRSQVKNMMDAQKLHLSLRSRQVHQWCEARSPQISFRR